MTTAEYIGYFIETLPAQLRPDKEIPSLNTWLVRARKNNWTPRELARIVAEGADYSKASSPIGLMVAVVERTSLIERTKFVEQPTYNEAHCRRANCTCVHISCYRGWFDGLSHTDALGRVYDATSPCPTCRPELYHILTTAPSREAAMEQIKRR